MGARYVPVSSEAFGSELRGFVPGVERKEVVYDLPSARIRGLRLRVYTSLAAGAGTARGCGADAIRVALLADYPQGGRTRGVHRFSSVYRVSSEASVLARLRERVGEAQKWAREQLAPCARCGGPAYRDSGRCLLGC